MHEVTIITVVFDHNLFIPTLTAFEFSLRPLLTTGDEATDGATTMDMAVLIVINTIPPGNLLRRAVIIDVRVTGGNATGTG